MENTNHLAEAQEAAKKITAVQTLKHQGTDYSFALTTRAMRVIELATKKTTGQLLDAIANSTITLDELIIVMVQGFSAPLIKAGKDAAHINEALVEDMMDEHPGLQVQVAKAFADACTRFADLQAAANPNR